MQFAAPHIATTIDPLAVSVLSKQLSGEALTPDAAAYDTARRLVNHRFDRHPAVIARVQNARDVSLAITFARQHQLEIAVRSGGHSVAGHSVGDGVMMIDLSGMKHIELAADRRSARVQPGATNGDLVMALAAHGLATTTGTCATVGMGGSTLGGGIGWLMGRFGATIDNVLSFEVVTADGEISIASAEQNPDLFWALRGGGGNFGVVTTITYRVHELRTIFGGMMVYPLATARSILPLYRDTTSAAPDELLAHAVMTTVPQFGPALIVQAVYSGTDLAEGERLLAPLRTIGRPAIDMLAARSYAEAYMMFTPPAVGGVSWHDTAYTLRRPSDAALDDMVACAMDMPAPTMVINVHQVHGAATRVPADATAFALREPHYAVANIAMWMQGNGEAEIGWAAAAKQRMAPHASSGTYVNFLGDDGEQAIRDAYRANYDRLVAIKTVYDPNNVFHRNQNVRPS